MLLAFEETPFVLQGPRPPIPPATWETGWLLATAVLLVIGLAAFAYYRIRRTGPTPLAPFPQLELNLRLAEALPPPAAITQATGAFRAYLAAIEPRAPASLSTEELISALSGLPVFLPARQPLLAALRSADAAKFAGAALEASLLIAGLHEAARRVQDAHRTFAQPVVAPLLPPRVGAPVAPVVPPPLPGPPPLPRKEPA